MSRCARCGLEAKYYGGPEYCEAYDDDGDISSNEPAIIACRDRELANLRSLLRSVTGKLEEAATRLAEVDVASCCEAPGVLGIVNDVLEALS